jgi:hypothetical protein
MDTPTNQTPAVQQPAKPAAKPKPSLVAGLLAVFLLLALPHALRQRARSLELEKETGELRRALQAAMNRPAAADVSVPAPAPDAPASDAGENHLLLEKEVATLRDLLADKERVISELQRNSRRRQGGGERGTREGGERGGDWAERMQRFQEENPERFKEMQERMQALRERMQTQAERQQNFVASLDPAKMTEAQKKDYARLNELLEKQRELTEAINVDPGGEGTNLLRQQLFEVSRESRELLEKQRAVALQDLGRQLGYQDAQAAQFADYVDNIIQSTSGGGPMMGGRPGGGRTPNP